jgi:hypothetical protein
MAMTISSSIRVNPFNFLNLSFVLVLIILESKSFDFFQRIRLPAGGLAVQNVHSIKAGNWNWNWFGEMAEWLKALVC